MATRHCFVGLTAVLLAICCGVGTGDNASAALIPITNPSFELDPMPVGQTYSVYPVGWASDGAGVYDVNLAAPGALPTPTDGHQIAWMNNNYLKQVLSTNLAPDTQYTLQADFSGATLPQGYTLTLYAGAGEITWLNSVTHASPVTPYVWETATVTYTSPSVVTLGQALEVYITINPANTPQLLIDNVRLNAVEVPEPASLSVLGIAALALLRRR